MTAEPELFRDAMETAISRWSTATGQSPPLAIFCADPHPLDPATLCRRLDGHDGSHAADGVDAWAAPTDPEETS